MPLEPEKSELTEEQNPLPAKARRRRPKLVVVIGLWCLCLPNLIASLLVMIDILVNYRSRSNFFIFWLAVAVVYLTTTIIYRVTRNYLKISNTNEESQQAKG